MSAWRIWLVKAILTSFFRQMLIPLWRLHLLNVGLSSIRDFEVIDCGEVKTGVDAERVVKKLRKPTPRIKVVKLHGDLTNRQLKFRLGDIYEFPEKLAEAVTEYIGDSLRSVIVVGHSLRDVDLNACFQAQGGAIWYVNPQRPTVNDSAGKVLANRPGSHFIDGEGGEFDRFFDGLFRNVQNPVREGDVLRISRTSSTDWTKLREIKSQAHLTKISTGSSYKWAYGLWQNISIPRSGS